MEFVQLNSRGGNYLVVAANVAWLRAGENGQTLVGIVGSSPLLVAGGMEETAKTILEAVNGPVSGPLSVSDQPAASPLPDPVPSVPAPV